MRVLVTGAAGRVGSTVARGLKDRYQVRGHDRVAMPDLEDTVISPLTDFDAVERATEGMDAIVHLGGNPGGGDWEEILNSNIIGTYNIFEAARINKVPTVVYGSSNHVTRWYEENGVLAGPNTIPRTDCVYGAGKIFGEALGRMYSDQHGIRVFCLRIAAYDGEDEPVEDYEPGLSRWHSPRDTAQMVWRCIEAEHLKFEIFYGASGSCEKIWDLSNAEDLIGYEPEDDGSLEIYRSRRQKKEGA